MSRFRPPLTRVLALLLLAQWAAAFAHCLAPLAGAAAAHGVEICTADGITTILLGEDDRPAPKPADPSSVLPGVRRPRRARSAAAARRLGAGGLDPAARARPVEGLPVAPARAPPQQPRAPPIA